MAQNIEQWRLIDGYNNYEVSSHGRVRNNVSNKILCSNVNVKSQYYQISLYLESKRKMHYVHRLVAFAFCDKPDGCDYADHIDRNNQNNDKTNLRWTTSRGNHHNMSKCSRNTTGITGVQPWKNSNGYSYWKVQIYDGDGKLKCKVFSVKKLGNDEAKRQAIEHRKDLERLYGYTCE